MSLEEAEKQQKYFRILQDAASSVEGAQEIGNTRLLTAAQKNYEILEARLYNLLNN